MSRTQTEIVGFAQNVRELLLKEHDALVAAGIDVDGFQRNLDKKIAAAQHANAQQESLKRQLKESTETVEATHDDLYRTSSGYLDAGIGAIGKGTPAAENFRRLRSRIRMPGDQGANASTPGGPAPQSQA